jgi:site-specific DNA-methyltransferase (adenine-specific)
MKPYYERAGITLYHGDALDVLPSLPDGVADSVVTDPPYKLAQEYRPNADPDNLLAVSSLWATAPEMLRGCRPGAVAAVFYDTRILPLALKSISHAGWKYLRALTLYRRWGVASLVDGWMTSSDFVLIFAKPGERPKFYGQPRHDVYVRERPDPFTTGHPAQKPREAVRHLVSNVTPPGGLVLDPYMGAGTTLEAAYMEGRRAIGIEAEEKWCEIAARRLEQMPLPLGMGA